jgi:heme exporter protein B
LPVKQILWLFLLALVVSLFPLAIGAEPNLLRQIAPGVIWVSALLASMLSTNRLFNDDYQDGILEQLLLSPCPLELIVLAKIFAHWCCTGLILIIASPFLALQFDLNSEAITVLMLGLTIGTPVLSCVGAIGSALTLGLKSSGLSFPCLPYHS